ncbi:hypothetical protein SISNIDRAFT_63688 [Sistotremastrum niveocremeum HHB9708]|uniref:DNA2/NAM7 helicase helicase domain-containing protein n=1 Tax=Sistotremastrum niveocremeum HHB9708 TaxID=1314777 RepID=A0A164VLS3_9AGAM|nr:hypothetical protein SISNIDRAFT_63688 [Sistotremastrum niveocremeum HHB9708]
MSLRFLAFTRLNMLLEQLLDLLFKFSHDANRKDDLKPTKVKNDIEEDALYVESGHLDVNSTHYRNRIRVGSEQRVVVNVVDIRNQRRLLTGITEHSEGKSARINMRAATLKDGDKVRIMSAMTIGKDDPTSAETQRTLVILKALQGDKETVNAPMFKRLWHPRIPIQPQIRPVSGAIGNHNLNPSQQEALKTMLSETDSLHLPLIIGPPGSGKTSVIARFVQMSVDLGRTVWVTAQSNVAVKNIADRLARDGFWDWRLLVSKDFHNDWQA